MHTEKLDNHLQTAAWGIILILLGGLSLCPGDQTSIFILGIGIILLGLNLLRYAKGIPTNAFSVALGTVALTLGGIASIRSILGWAFRLELSLFPILLIAIGLYLLIPARNQKENR